MSDSLLAPRSALMTGTAMFSGPQPEPESGPAAYPGEDGPLLTRLVKYFEAAEEATATARRESERDRAYYDLKMWTPEEEAALRKRGQAPIVIPYIPDKIQLMSGIERRARTDPKAVPRTPSEDNRADAATQALRFVADDTGFQGVRSDVYESMLIEGFGGAEVVVEPGQGMDVEIKINQIPWDRLFYDPHSRRQDFRDARYLGMVLWMDRDEALDMFPGSDDVLTDTFATAVGAGNSFDDRPGTAWCDNQRTRVRVVQIFWIERGEWWEATFTRGGFLSPPAGSPYLDRHGKSCCRLILQSLYVAQDNARYGVVRGLISLQDEINKRRSKALHLLSVNQIIADNGAVADVDHARREAAKPDGYIEKMQGFEFTIQKGGDLASGQFQLLQHATAEMQGRGANSSLAGKDPRDLSGRAIIAQQAGGQAQIEPTADALRDWTRRIYEAAWMRVRQYWTSERWVRVTDTDGNTDFLGLNRQVTVADELKAMPPDRRAVVMQNMQIQPNDPRLAMVVRTENNVSDLEVDITIEEGPDVPTLAAEEFQQLSQMLPGMLPAMAPPVQIKLFTMMVSASSLKGKDKLVEILGEAEKVATQPPPPPPPAMQAMAEAKVRETNAGAALKEAGAAEKQAETVTKVAHLHQAHSAMMAAPEPMQPAYPAPLA